jgi:RNase P subunit RPR2
MRKNTMKKRFCDKCQGEIPTGTIFYTISECNKGRLKKVSDMCLSCFKKPITTPRNKSGGGLK